MTKPHALRSRRSYRPALLASILLPLLLSSCHDPLASRSLVVLGYVHDASTGAAIAGAFVQVVCVLPYCNDTADVPVGSDSTDALGYYRIRVATPPRYSYPNCSILRVDGSAQGYEPASGTTAGDPGCEPPNQPPQIRVDLTLSALGAT